MGGGSSKKVSNHVEPDPNNTPEVLEAKRAIAEAQKELEKVKEELVRVHADVENERRSVRAKMKLKRGRLDNIIREVKRNNGVEDDVIINKNIIRQRSSPSL